MISQYLSPSTDILILSIVFGAIIGVWYSLFSLLQVINAMPTPMVVILDVVFGISSAILIFMFTYSTNEGVFRIYEAVGLLVGFFTYYFTLGRVVLLLFLKIVALYKRIFVFLYKNTVVKIYIILDKSKKKGKIIIEKYLKDNFQKKLYKKFLKSI